MADPDRATPAESPDFVYSSAQVRTDIGTAEISDEIIGEMWDAASQGSRTKIIKATTVVKTQIENTEGVRGAGEDRS